MKKIMIACAVVAMAACSQAAMVYWSFADSASDNSSKNPPWTYFTDSGKNDLTGYTAYLILDSAWDSSDVAGSLAKATASSALKTSTITATAANFKTGTLTANKLDDKTYVPGTTADFRVVLANGDKYWASDKIADVSILETDSIATEFTAASVNFAKETAIKASEMKSMSSDVPEPTSGLLLLLGMAGLALRRRRA